MFPRVQVQSASTDHVEEQPSLSLLFPSSQYPKTGLKTIPSPHISVHELAVDESPKVHVQPGSTEHVEEQPSLSAFPPSSQYPAVGFITFPSPQVSCQLLAVEESPSVQVHPASTEQVDDHPSPSIILESSQYPDAGLNT